MGKRYKPVILFGVLIGAVTVFFGCGGIGRRAEGEAETEGEKVQLEIYAWQDEETNMHLLASEYMEKNPDVKIHINIVPISEYSQKMLSLKNGGQQADCVFSPTTAEAAVWMKKGLLKNMDSRAGITDLREHFDDWYRAGEEGGESYMLPYRQSRWAVFYNKHLFDRLGAAYPEDDWTWEDYAETAVRLTGRMDGEKTYGSLSFEPNNIWWRVPARTAGANDPSNASELDAFMKAARWCYELTYEKKAQIPYTEQTGGNGFSYDARFLEGNIGMYFSGDWSVGVLNSAIDGQGLDFAYDIAPMPHWAGEEGYAISDAAVVSVMENTSYPEEALDFVCFVSGRKGAELLSENGVIPAWNEEAICKKYLESVKVPEHAENFFTDGSISMVPASVKYSENMEIVKSEVSLYLLKEQDMEQTEENIRKAIGLLW